MKFTMIQLIVLIKGVKFLKRRLKNWNFFKYITVTTDVREGLAKHKEQCGASLCPCGHYDSEPKEAANTFWNCLCSPMRTKRISLNVTFTFKK